MFCRLIVDRGSFKGGGGHGPAGSDRTTVLRDFDQRHLLQQILAVKRPASRHEVWQLWSRISLISGVFRYSASPSLLDMAAEVWDATVKLNAELQVLGPLELGGYPASVAIPIANRNVRIHPVRGRSRESAGAAAIFRL